ncbi:MAG TPA: tetratricopeptide repeat protein [Candidatus Baltobacteraceae bacterium]|nr:tetratricopeptide repeat protein [Candidatus Baltobacteraceae bacterium]
MEIPLEGAGQKTGLVIATLAVAALMIFQASRMWLADVRIHSEKIDEMERGTALVPGDAQAWDLLGHFYQYDFMQADLPRALGDYRRAVGNDPQGADYWLDLGSALEATGNVDEARRAFARAQAVYPDSAEVDFYYGNFLLRQEEFPGAYEQLRRAAAADPKLVPVVISRVWRATEDVRPLLDQVLPANAGSYEQALDFFGAAHRGDEAIEVWERMRQLRESIPLPETFPLIDELIHEDRADDARRVWTEALATAGLPNQGPTGGSLIWDGDFKTDFAEGGLGWRWDAPPDASIDFDPQVGPNGSRVVRLDFTGGANVEVGSPLEYVPAEPSTTYHFHASMRTDGITTESGMRFLISDPNHKDAVNVLTDNMTGTQPWTSIGADLTTGAETHFLLVQLVRYPSRLFDNKLGGTAWIGDISLTPGAAPSGSAANAATGAGGEAQPQ